MNFHGRTLRAVLKILQVYAAVAARLVKIWFFVLVWLIADMTVDSLKTVLFASYLYRYNYCLYTQRMNSNLVLNQGVESYNLDSILFISFGSKYNLDHQY